MKIYITYSLIFVSLFFVSCWSSDGLGDTEECSAYRNEDIDTFNMTVAMYLSCMNSSPPEKIYNCNGLLLLIPGNRSCSEPAIPFPWYKPKKLPGQTK